VCVCVRFLCVESTVDVAVNVGARVCGCEAKDEMCFVVNNEQTIDIGHNTVFLLLLVIHSYGYHLSVFFRSPSLPCFYYFTVKIGFRFFLLVPKDIPWQAGTLHVPTFIRDFVLFLLFPEKKAFRRNDKKSFAF